MHTVPDPERDPVSEEDARYWRQAESDDYRKRYDADYWRSALIHHYYTFLNGNERFTKALSALFSQMNGASPADRQTAVDTFCQEWPLPSRARSDLFTSYALQDSWDAPLTTEDYARLRLQHPDLPPTLREWASQAPPGLGPRLVQSPSGDALPIIGTADEIARLGNPLPLIVVGVREVFEYHPLFDDRKCLNEQLDRLCRSIREQAQRQAEEYERQAREAGYTPRPPWYSKPDHLRSLAFRMYQRAILKMAWAKITDAEASAAPSDNPDQVTDEDSLRKTTASAAKLCGIPLH